MTPLKCTVLSAPPLGRAPVQPPNHLESLTRKNCTEYPLKAYSKIIYGPLSIRPLLPLLKGGLTFMCSSLLLCNLLFNLQSIDKSDTTRQRQVCTSETSSSEARSPCASANASTLARRLSFQYQQKGSFHIASYRSCSKGLTWALVC